MAGRGPAPAQSRGRKRDTPERTKLVAGEKPRGIALPKGVLPDGDEWHPMTLKWWEAWRKSPQASRMLSDPDWFFLLDTALLHHIMWSRGKWEFAAEVRLRVAKFGATPEDRLRLKQEIEVPETTPVGSGPGATVTSIEARRSRLSE